MQELAQKAPIPSPQQGNPTRGSTQNISLFVLFLRVFTFSLRNWPIGGCSSISGVHSRARLARKVAQAPINFICAGLRIIFGGKPDILHRDAYHIPKLKAWIGFLMEDLPPAQAFVVFVQNNIERC